MLLLRTAICSVIALVSYWIMTRNYSPGAIKEDTPYMLCFIYGVGYLFFVVYFLNAFFAFYRSRSIQARVLTMSIFDNNEQSNVILDSSVWFAYSSESLLGSFEGFPLSITYIPSKGKSERSRVSCSLYYPKFNVMHSESVDYSPRRFFLCNVKQDLKEAAEKLRLKGYGPATIDQVMKECKIVPAER